MTRVDARGKSCPQPVIMTKAKVEAGEREIEVVLDNPVSASNVQRFLEKNGYTLQMGDENGIITIRGVRDTPDAGSEPSGAPTEDFSCQLPRQDDNVAILIAHEVLGGDDRLLGEVLMKAFLGTLMQMDRAPAVVALMNEGVRLALRNTPSSEHLQALQSKGTRVLVCGTCTNHFGITSDVGVGTISNMFEITESVLAARKRLTL